MESLPQVHISAIALAGGIIEVAIYNYNDDGFENHKTLAIFFTSFSLSVFASSYGIANFMLKGPVKLVQSAKSFVLLILCIAAWLIGKAIWLAFSVSGETSPVTVLQWLGWSILPNFTLVSIRLAI